MKKIMTSALMGLVLCAPASYAESVEFSIGEKTGSFNCLATDPNATVTIQSHSLDIKGACQGQPYVPRPGRLTNLPVSVLNENYFEITKTITKKGSAEITVSRGSVLCKPGHGGKSKSYGKGGYCAVPNPE